MLKSNLDLPLTEWRPPVGTSAGGSLAFGNIVQRTQAPTTPGQLKSYLTGGSGDCSIGSGIGVGFQYTDPYGISMGTRGNRISLLSHFWNFFLASFVPNQMPSAMGF
jgi:hypothetical protein